MKATVTELVSERLGPEQAEHLATTLATGVFTHDYPINVEEAQTLHLTVSTTMPEEVYNLMSLYPQTAQRRPSVEYIPTPHGPRENEERRPMRQR